MDFWWSFLWFLIVLFSLSNKRQHAQLRLLKTAWQRACSLDKNYGEKLWGELWQLPVIFFVSHNSCPNCAPAHTESTSTSASGRSGMSTKFREDWKSGSTDAAAGRVGGTRATDHSDGKEAGPKSKQFFGNRTVLLPAKPNLWNHFCFEITKKQHPLQCPEKVAIFHVQGKWPLENNAIWVKSCAGILLTRI